MRLNFNVHLGLRLSLAVAIILGIVAQRDPSQQKGGSTKKTPWPFPLSSLPAKQPSNASGAQKSPQASADQRVPGGSSPGQQGQPQVAEAEQAAEQQTPAPSPFPKALEAAEGSAAQVAAPQAGLAGPMAMGAPMPSPGSAPAPPGSGPEIVANSFVPMMPYRPPFAGRGKGKYVTSATAARLKSSRGPTCKDQHSYCSRYALSCLPGSEIGSPPGPFTPPPPPPPPTTPTTPLTSSTNTDQMDDFSGVVVKGPTIVRLRQLTPADGLPPGKALVRTTPPDLNSRIYPPPPVFVRNDMLMVGFRDNSVPVTSVSAATTTFNHLETLEQGTLTSDGDIDLSGGKLNIRITGTSGNIYLRKVSAHRITIIQAAGTGEVTIRDGTAKTLIVVANGSGTINLYGLRAETATVSVFGSGVVRVLVDSILNVRMYGSGSVIYRGNGRIGELVKQGPGKIIRRPNKPSANPGPPGNSQSTNSNLVGILSPAAGIQDATSDDEQDKRRRRFRRQARQSASRQRSNPFACPNCGNGNFYGPFGIQPPPFNFRQQISFPSYLPAIAVAPFLAGNNGMPMPGGDIRYGFGYVFNNGGNSPNPTNWYNGDGYYGFGLRPRIPDFTGRNSITPSQSQQLPPGQCATVPNDLMSAMCPTTCNQCGDGKYFNRRASTGVLQNYQDSDILKICFPKEVILGTITDDDIAKVTDGPTIDNSTCQDGLALKGHYDIMTSVTNKECRNRCERDDPCVASTYDVQSRYSDGNCALYKQEVLAEFTDRHYFEAGFETCWKRGEIYLKAKRRHK